MDAARERQQFRSDAELARELAISGPSLANWRNDKGFPGDHVMVDLATLAGIDPVEALLDLNRLRAKEERAARVYGQALERLQQRFGEATKHQTANGGHQLTLSPKRSASLQAG